MGEEEAEGWLSTSKGTVGVISNYHNGRSSKAVITAVWLVQTYGAVVNHHVPRGEVDEKPAAFLTLQAKGLQGEQTENRNSDHKKRNVNPQLVPPELTDREAGPTRVYPSHPQRKCTLLIFRPPQRALRSLTRTAVH